MLILALESSAVAASAALCKDGVLKAQVFQNNGLTHSVTLLPMVDHMLEDAGLTVGDVDLIACAVGPGSFTGLRIGISEAKGLAWSLQKPCAAVSTLEAMARNVSLFDGVILCAMDARRQQIYNAVFSCENGVLCREKEDRAISLDELSSELADDIRPKLVVGDGAVLCFEHLKNAGIAGLRLAPENLRLQSAWGVAQAAMVIGESGGLTDGGGLAPQYHRLSQAERERLAGKGPAAKKA